MQTVFEAGISKMDNKTVWNRIGKNRPKLTQKNLEYGPKMNKKGPKYETKQ